MAFGPSWLLCGIWLYRKESNNLYVPWESACFDGRWDSSVELHRSGSRSHRCAIGPRPAIPHRTQSAMLVCGQQVLISVNFCSTKSQWWQGWGATNAPLNTYWCHRSPAILSQLHKLVSQFTSHTVPVVSQFTNHTIPSTLNILPNAGQESNIAQPKTNKWFSFSLHFSSFLIV